MNFDVSDSGIHKVVKINGALNLYNAGQLKKDLTTLIESDDNIKSLVVDMTDSPLLDSSGIAALAALQKKMKSEGGILYLIKLNESVSSALRLSGLDKHFKMFSTLADVPS